MAFAVGTACSAGAASTYLGVSAVAPSRIRQAASHIVPSLSCEESLRGTRWAPAQRGGYRKAAVDSAPVSLSVAPFLAGNEFLDTDHRKENAPTPATDRGSLAERKEGGFYGLVFDRGQLYSGGQKGARHKTARSRGERPSND